MIVNPSNESVVGKDTAGTGRVTVPETIWLDAKVTVEPSLWRRSTVPVHGSMYVSPWKMMSTSGAGEIWGGMPVGMLPGAPGGGGVITNTRGGTPGTEIGTSPANVNVSPSVVIVVGNVGIGIVTEPTTMPGGPIIIVEPSASVVVVNAEPMGIVVPSTMIAGVVPKLKGNQMLEVRI